MKQLLPNRTVTVPVLSAVFMVKWHMYYDDDYINLACKQYSCGPSSSVSTSAARLMDGLLFECGLIMNGIKPK